MAADRYRSKEARAKFLEQQKKRDGMSKAGRDYALSVQTDRPDDRTTRPDPQIAYRLVAFLINFGPPPVLSIVSLFAFSGLVRDPRDLWAFVTTICAVVFTGWMIACIVYFYLMGTSPGKRILRLRIVDTEGRLIPKQKAMIRFAYFFFPSVLTFGIFLVIDGIYLLISGYALHDLWSDTAVVRTDDDAEHGDDEFRNPGEPAHRPSAASPGDREPTEKPGPYD